MERAPTIRPAGVAERDIRHGDLDAMPHGPGVVEKLPVAFEVRFVRRVDRARLMALELFECGVDPRAAVPTRRGEPEAVDHARGL